MQPETTLDILDLMDGCLTSAALGAAMELGLFWRLAERPLPAGELAQSLNIPLNRCQAWLQVLCKLGLLEKGSAGYAPSKVARRAILEAHSQATWAFHAREERDGNWFVQDLAANIRLPISAWQIRNLPPPDYTQQIKEDPGYAAQFTRKLCAIHLALAEQVAALLDLRGIHSMLDLGGGSGVMSFALLRKQPALTSIVVDAENVCRAGREIARENALEGRITYRAADILQDDLPSGFDLLLLCDVGSFSESLFHRIYQVLNPQGRLVLVDKFAPSPTEAPPSRLSGALLEALENPAQSLDFTTVETVQARLQQAGFRILSLAPVPHPDNLPWNIDWTLLEAGK